MRCKRCNKKVLDSEFCRGCFVKVIEKRVRKTIRIGLGLKKGDKILVLDPLSRYFAEKLSPIISLESRPKSFFKIRNWDDSVYHNQQLKDFIKKNKISIVLIPLTMESDLELYLENIFSGKKADIKRHKSIFPLFQNLNSQELELFCKFKNIRFKLKKGKFSKFLDMIEKQYRGTKSSFYNAIKQ